MVGDRIIGKTNIHFLMIFFFCGGGGGKLLGLCSSYKCVLSKSVLQWARSEGDNFTTFFFHFSIISFSKILEKN